MPDARHAESLQRVLVGWMCEDCSMTWLYGPDQSNDERLTPPHRCEKCNSYAIEVLEQEFPKGMDKSKVKQLYYRLKDMRRDDNAEGLEGRQKSHDDKADD